MEIAFISSNKIYLEIEKKQDGFLSQILTRLTANPSRFIVSMLIGNTIALVVYGFFMGELIVQWLADFGYQFTIISQILLQILISTSVVLQLNSTAHLSGADLVLPSLMVVPLLLASVR